MRENKKICQQTFSKKNAKGNSLGSRKMITKANFKL